MIFRSKWFLCSLFFLLFSKTLFANTQSFGTIWFNGTFIGPLSKQHEKWKYFIQPRFVIIDNRYGIDEGRIFYGAGYQITPVFAPYIGASYLLSVSTVDGTYFHENSLWQQYLWDMHQSRLLKIDNRTRIEERKNTRFSQWAIRLREQFSFKIPFQNTKYSLLSFDELFFNLNHPSWVSDKVISQNRYFIGVQKSISKSASFDFGYINQARFQRQNLKVITHGLYLRINVV